MDTGIVRPKEEVETVVRETLRTVPVPATVIDVRVAAGVDTSGDPAVHITFDLRPGNLNDAELNEIKAAVYAMTRRVLDLDLGSFPYFRLEQAA